MKNLLNINKNLTNKDRVVLPVDFVLPVVNMNGLPKHRFHASLVVSFLFWVMGQPLHLNSTRCLPVFESDNQIIEY